MSNVSRLLSQMDDGDKQASQELLPLVYDELHKLAAARMANERKDHTLQATALVHEAYAKLVGSDAEPKWNSRAHFFSAASEAMRRVLVDYARTRKRDKRGRDFRRVELDDVADTSNQKADYLVELDAALQKLAEESTVKAKLVELRYFAGLSHQESAKILNISRATADRYWAYAKLFLYAEIEDSINNS